jgi:hypothetical protein
VGGSDTRAQAESFVAFAGGPPHTLWSESYEAWNHYNAGSPRLVLLDGAGVTEVERISGFNRSRIENALDSLS